jgi:acetyl-CoA carboxylase carboxyltransferase component
VTKEELGGSKIHTRISGVADNEAPGEHAAMDLVRSYLSYFPSSAWQSPPVSEPVAPSGQDDILHIIPRQPARPYSMHKVLSCIFDGDSILEIKPAYAPNMITALARLEGHPVGIVANQPAVRAGIIDAAAADKATHFLQLCDAYHLPLIFFADVPGFMTGTKAEQEGTLRRGLRMAHVLGHTTVPMVSIVVRKAFGMGGVAMGGSGMGQNLTLAWPTAQFGTMPMRGAVQAAHRRELEAGTRTLEELSAGYETYNDIFGPAESFQVDDIVHPGETRGRVARALAAARQDPQPRGYKHGIMP